MLQKKCSACEKTCSTRVIKLVFREVTAREDTLLYDLDECHRPINPAPPRNLPKRDLDGRVRLDSQYSSQIMSMAVIRLRLSSKSVTLLLATSIISQEVKILRDHLVVEERSSLAMMIVATVVVSLYCTKLTIAS